MNKLSWITISASLLSSLTAAADAKVNDNSKITQPEPSIEAPSQLNKSIKKIQLNKKPVFAGVNCVVRTKA